MQPASRERVQGASGGYRGAGGSVLVAMDAGCQHGTDAAGQLVLLTR